MTATVRIQTVEGLVFAADGRARDEQLKEVKNDCQKIFPIHGSPIAYAVYGMAGIGNEGTPDIIVDVCQELANFNRDQKRNISDLVAYGNKMTLPVYRSLLKAKNSGLLEKYPGDLEPGQRDPTVFHVWLLGYANGMPIEVDVRLSHRNQRLYKPVAIKQQLWLGYPPKTLGSGEVHNLLYRSDDERLARFRRAMPSRQEDLTILEAVEVAANYIKACDSDEGREVDPRLCPGIGGRIHIATITPLSGFQWAKGYEPT